jgi:DNA repair protein RecN (Recombination protein N)
LAARCAELGFTPEDGLLFIQRELFSEGRSQGRVQGRMIPISSLRALGQLLVDLHGQHDHQSLLHPEQHLGFLDLWIGPEVERLLADLGQKLAMVRDIEKRLQEARTCRREREQRLDLLQFQVQEIESVGPREGEVAELEALLSRLRHAERLSETAQSVLETLARKEGSATETMGQASRELAEAVALDPGLQLSLEPLRESLFLLEESLAHLRSYADGIEADPARLEEAVQRLDALRRLRKKYGDDETAVLGHLERAKAELAAMQEGEADEESLVQRLAERSEVLSKACADLTALRVRAADRFGALVQEQLRELAMGNAKFEVHMTPKPVDASGADVLEFLFSANKGEPVRPLAKIASGGEIARLMLAIKTVLAGKAGVPTLIFDEVESGLGGATAAVVGRKLEELARQYQVIVISHLPQIAGRALTHFRIEKLEAGGRVATTVRSLDPRERVDEIARMLAGESVGETALAHAKELLSGA